MDTQNSALSPSEKRDLRIKKWLAAENIQFNSPEAKETFQQRESRVDAAIRLQIPDRIPVWLQDIGFFPARYTGITFQKMMYDDAAMASAIMKVMEDFQPDLYWPIASTPGKALDILDCKQVRWPGGHGFSPNMPMQYIEGEYMKADEYNALLFDPSDYILRVYLPRIVGSLSAFQKLPTLRRMLNGYPGLQIGMSLADPEVVAAFKCFYEAGLEMQKQAAILDKLQKDMRSAGFTPACGGGSLPPFDVMSDTLRGMKGVMLDMYRQPDRLLEAIEKITPYMVENLVNMAVKSGNPRAMLGMHRGSDGFLSKKQWETFYWPGYKKLALALIAEGITPVFFLEGNVTSRLEYFTELPKGWAMGIFDTTDVYKAKQILGGHMCISGMMPVSVLQMGTPDEVKAAAKELIDVVGKDGGFIMGPRSVLDEAKPELVKIWVDFTREYGQYR
jgi:hypothetical protein